MKAAYPCIDDLVLVRFCNEEDYKVLAHHGICSALNGIVRSRQALLVRVLPIILANDGLDHGESLKKIDSAD